MNSLITVIVPMFNSEKTIEKCLDSIINQSYENLEIILVDDYSTDNTLKVCEKYLLKDKRIKIVKNESKGVAMARNTGIKYALGDYIGFVDSDDYIDKNMYMELYTKLNENHSDIAVCGFYHVEDNIIKQIYIENENFELDSKEALKMMIDEKYTFSVCPWNKLVKKELYDNISFPIGVIYDDLATIYKLILKAKKIIYFSKEHYYYQVNQESTCRKEIYNSKVKKKIEIMNELYNLVTDNYNELENDFKVFLIVQYMSVINSMIKSEKFDRYVYIEFQKHVFKNINKIIKNKIISIKKKIQILILATSFKIYKNMYLRKIYKNEKIIYCNMYGRLGNQFFRYAFCKEIQFFNKGRIIIDFSNVYKKGFENDLEKFNIDNYIEVKKSRNFYIKQATIKQRFLIWGFKWISKLFNFIHRDKQKLKNFQLRFQPTLNKNGIFYLELGLNKVDYKKIKTRFIYTFGCYESKEYFRNVNMDIFKEFVPRKELLEKNKDLYEKILNTESICLTIRRGDFIGLSLYSICNDKYYMNAIDRMNEKVKDGTYFIFSDDIEWCKKNITIKNKEVFFEDGTDDVAEKIRLMSACKNFILSNSTFSWWAQYLSQNKNKIVVAPEKWYNDEIESDLIEKEWEFIKYEK